MTLAEFIQSTGVSAEDANTFAADAKMSKIFEASQRQYEAGVSAKADADKATADLNKWWKDEAQPAILSADNGGAQSKADAARYRTYLEDMKAKGYPVNDEWLGTAPKNDPAPAAQNNFNPQEFAMGQAEAMTMLYDLGSEYAELHDGKPLPNAHGLLQEAKASGKNLRDLVRSKFDFEGKRAARSEAKINERIEAARKDERDKAMADAAKHQNPLLAPAVTSRAAQVTEAAGDNKDSWKTKQGRNEARRDRLEQFRPFGKAIMATSNSVN